MKQAEQNCRNVLIVSDETETVRGILEVLAGKAIRGTVVQDARAAIEKSASGQWDLLMAEAGLPGGLELIRAFKRQFPDRPVVLMGAEQPDADAESPARQACDDVLAKPISAPALSCLLDSLVPGQGAGDEDDGYSCRIAGRSEALLQTVRLARKIAPTSVPVLITGESGTGKELLSSLIHRYSTRASGPYIRVNCAALSETLLESELFGHERGAFTGAIAQRKGRFERADGGTLLLDEISETGPRLQAELLRVLEQQDFERLGGSERVQVNVRVIATTNRDLARDVQQGRFRGDLFYRINGVSLVAPPLRQRMEDLPALVWHFVNEYAHEVRRKITGLGPRMLAAFRRYDWPGNIRQLRNIVRTAMIVGEGPVLSLEGAEFLMANPMPAPHVEAPDAAPGTLRLRELERRAILEALERSQRNQAKAARLLGITDRTLREKLRRYRQDAPAPAPAPAEANTVGEAIW